ncbi:MAG: diaminopimelate decarboxylase, partial [Pseudonocardiaceae bacterium]
VVFHGKNKSMEEREYAAQLGVGCVVVDSFSELERLAEIGKRTRHTFKVLLRVTPGVLTETHRFVATGQDDVKFGFTLSAGVAHKAAARALALDRICLNGVHCHIGSQITNTDGFDAAAELMLSFLADLRRTHGIHPEELNLGGGLGIAYLQGDVAITIEEYANALLRAVRRGAAHHDLTVPKLSVEPGRSIAGPAGVTVYTVGTIKRIPGARTYVSVDGGMSDNLRPALYGSRYTIRVGGSGCACTSMIPVTIVGKHCEAGDLLVRDTLLPDDLAEGDLVVAAVTGAYGYAMASNYNRLPRPAMVLVGDGRADLLVRRETLDDVVARDSPLP